jgi:cysteine-rich repeat protein
MIIGTNSACIEKCGDGKNYGLRSCDDGNLKNGDGCNNNILVKFTRPINLNDTNDSGLTVTVTSRDGDSKVLEWKIQSISMPSSYLYIVTTV